MIAATSAAVVKAVQAKLEKEGTSMASIMEHSAQYRIQAFLDFRGFDFRNF